MNEATFSPLTFNPQKYDSIKFHDPWKAQSKMTIKVITDYISDSTMKLKHHMHTSEAQEKYKDRMPNVEPR